MVRARKQSLVDNGVPKVGPLKAPVNPGARLLRQRWTQVTFTDACVDVGLSQSDHLVAPVFLGPPFNKLDLTQLLRALMWQILVNLKSQSAARYPPLEKKKNFKKKKNFTSGGHQHGAGSEILTT